MNQSSDEDASVDNNIFNLQQSSISLINVEKRQLPSMNSLDGVQILDIETTSIKLGKFIPTTSALVIEPIHSGVSTSTAAKHTTENLNHKAKRMKKSQALIQSRIVTQASSVQASVQQPLLNLSLGRAADHVGQNQSNNGQSANHHNQGGTQQLQQNNSASIAANNDNIVKHQKVIKNHRTLQKRMISLQSERISTSEVASTKAAAQILKHGSGSHPSKTALMVISSSGVHISKPGAANNSGDEDSKVVQDSSFDNRISVAPKKEYMDKHSSMVAFSSPVKPSHKLQTAVSRGKGVESLPTQNSQKEQISTTSIKSTLKPLVLQKAGGASGIVQQPCSAMPVNTALSKSKQSCELDQSLPQTGLTHGSMSGASNNRQTKNIRNSFNNFFVTSKQQASEHQIKLRMSSVEHRNELKNYLELASLAGDNPINDQASTKGTKLYKRANPMIHQNHDLTEQQQQRMTNGFEAARKQNNNSQLQALNNANAQMMPALQNISGIRNQNNRTTMGQQHASQTVQKKHMDQQKNGVYVNKSKREKPYQQHHQQQEPYRIMATYSAQGMQGPSGPGSTQSKLVSQTNGAGGGGTNPKFMAQRSSPGAHSQLNKQYTDFQQATSNFVSQGSVNGNQQHSDNSSLQTYLGQSKLPAKFISAKSNMLGKAQPVRARTNLDKYEDMGQSYNQTNQGNGATAAYDQRRQAVGSIPGPQTSYHTIIGASSSVSTIPSLDGIYNGGSSSTNNNQTGNTTVVLQAQSSSSHQDNSSIQSLVQTPQTGTISSRKLSSQFVMSSQKPLTTNQTLVGSNPQGPYNHSAKVTIEPISASLPGGAKKNKFQLHSSKMVLEPLSSSSINNQSTLINGPSESVSSPDVVLISKPESSQSNTKQHLHNHQQKLSVKPQASLSLKQKAPGRVASSQAKHKSDASHQKQQVLKDKSSYVMLPIAPGSQHHGGPTTLPTTNSGPTNVAVVNPILGQNSKLSQRTTSHANNKTTESEQQRRASHQPLSIMQNRISSQMAYRCYSRQKDSRVQSRGGSRGSRQRTSGVAAGEGDLGPLPRALNKQQANDNSLIVLQSEKVHRELSGRREQEIDQDPFETERQLIIARGGSLSRKVNHIMDDDEDVFNDRGGFRIKINKEQKVVNHLEDRVENNNLLFYNFNAYKQDQTLENGANNYGSTSYQTENTESAQQRRPNSRTSQQSKSRQDFRQRHIQSAASVSSVSKANQSRQRIGVNHQIKVAAQQEVQIDNGNENPQDQKQLYRKDSNHHNDSCTSLQTSHNGEHSSSFNDPQLNMRDEVSAEPQIPTHHNNNNETSNSSTTSKYINANPRNKAGGSNRYKQGSSNILNLDQHSGQSHSANRHDNNLAVNVTSSGSLTTAATTKGSDFGTTKHQQQNGGGTPQRNGSIAIMKEVVVPARPTNTSRILHDQAHNQSMRKHRGQRGGNGGGAEYVNNSEHQQQEKNSEGGQLPSQYSIIKASQTSIGSNSFARSAMRLKQKSSRNGIPNRGGSLDGCSQNAQSQSPSSRHEDKSSNAAPISQITSSAGIMQRAGRTAGGAMWSRMLNMQSVEEGIQEGNVSSEDD